ncbi:hypothetical protein FJ420_21315 [Mesorhizobium sp. B3-1-3]|uniref:hypothetical protein n=1 Tax=unclassified Mesorhizobium TaxID=325217 RepID=UPI00112A6023|nr:MULTISPECIES: hypothetical protein [unclassified Mesorhizobium]TPI59860.1 hypothetical protein FJ424_24760 [Mesorhizobium sp. B3-1-8]TPI68228.1 hypothetical protein FJ420_21315 [Mesorhizobium sp. B3-1-3]
MAYRSIIILILGTALAVVAAAAEERVVKSVNLLGIASMEQEVVYNTSEADYLKTRDDILERLKKGDPTAAMNPADGPWMQVETTAKIGFEIKDVGLAQGKKNLRQVSAAEEALSLYDKWKADGN